MSSPLTTSITDLVRLVPLAVLDTIARIIFADQPADFPADRIRYRVVDLNTLSIETRSLTGLH